MATINIVWHHCKQQNIFRIIFFRMVPYVHHGKEYSSNDLSDRRTTQA